MTGNWYDCICALVSQKYSVGHFENQDAVSDGSLDWFIRALRALVFLQSIFHSASIGKLPVWIPKSILRARSGKGGFSP